MFAALHTACFEVAVVPISNPPHVNQYYFRGLEPMVSCLLLRLWYWLLATQRRSCVQLMRNEDGDGDGLLG